MLEKCVMAYSNVYIYVYAFFSLLFHSLIVVQKSNNLNDKWMGIYYWVEFNHFTHTDSLFFSNGYINSGIHTIKWLNQRLNFKWNYFIVISVEKIRMTWIIYINISTLSLSLSSTLVSLISELCSFVASVISNYYDL